MLTLFAFERIEQDCIICSEFLETCIIIYFVFNYLFLQINVIYSAYLF